MSTKDTKRLNIPIGSSLIVLSSFFYASYGIWTRMMGDFFGGYTASALRSILVLVILMPIALWYRKFEPINWKRNWQYLAGLTFVFFFIWGLLYYSILHAGIGISLGVNYAMIVIGSFILGSLFASERFTKDKAISALFGIVGLALVFGSSVGNLGWKPLVAVVISGLASAVYNLIAKRMPYNATQSTVLIWVTSAIANVIMALILSEVHPEIGWHAQWLYLVVFALMSVIASWTFVKGIQLVEVGIAGILGLLEIVFGVLLGVIFFKEQLGIVVLIGMAIIIAAASIPYLQELHKSSEVH